MAGPISIPAGLAVPEGIYACMYVRMYVFYSQCPLSPLLFQKVCVCLHVCMCACMHVCSVDKTWLPARVNNCKAAYARSYIDACMNVYVSVCVCLLVGTHVRME